jgi:periplasmic protein TonB
MSEQRTLVPRTDRAFLAESRRVAPEDPKQRKLMVGSLCLLLLALGIVLWHNRDFWFPDTTEAESDQPVKNSPQAEFAPAQPAAPVAKSGVAVKRKHYLASEAKVPAAPVATPAPASASSTLISPVAITARTTLPPLEVEVVAGDTHRTIRPGSSSLRVDLQPGTPAQAIGDAGNAETGEKVTSDAAERIPMSADASEIVARSVRPNYPMLARQMKVQGSVILQALIGKDGVIQNLRVVSGPHILASAAQDAVRQWHFKPHLEGSEAVETQAMSSIGSCLSAMANDIAAVRFRGHASESIPGPLSRLKTFRAHIMTLICFCIRSNRGALRFDYLFDVGVRVF